MPTEPIDKWLEALEFENHRLSFKPNVIQAEILASQIRELESQPVDTMADGDLEARLERLDALKQHLASIRQVVGFARPLYPIAHQLLELARDRGPANWNPVKEAVEAFDRIIAWHEKTRIEQKEKFARNLVSLRYFWPQADTPRKSRMRDLFITYTWRRFSWGALNLTMTTLSKNARWASRKMQSRR